MNVFGDPGVADRTSLFASLERGSGNYAHEKALLGRGFQRIGGCDEVGRGPLAGPVVAACVILPAHADPALFLDSKQLTHLQRVKLLSLLDELGAKVGIGVVDVATIDTINILQSSLLAMRFAVEQLRETGDCPDFVLVDGKFEIPLAIPQLALVKGESKSGSIAAASIVAKVERDAIMDRMHERFPCYGFDRHKGYPTKAHRLAIAEHGPCPEHRTTFAGVKQFLP